MGTTRLMCICVFVVSGLHNVTDMHWNVVCALLVVFVLMAEKDESLRTERMRGLFDLSTSVVFWSFLIFSQSI